MKLYGYFSSTPYNGIEWFPSAEEAKRSADQAYEHFRNAFPICWGKMIILGEYGCEDLELDDE